MVPEVRSICIGVHCVKEYPKQLSIEWEEKRDQIPEDLPRRGSCLKLNDDRNLC